MNVPDIELKSVTKRFGRFEAVKDLDLSVERGELVCLLGPSGCGKTTTLRMIAGFEIPTKGRIIIQGKDVTDIAPNKRNTGMVFQSYALFPHMTVFKNMAYGLKNHKVPKDEIKTRVRKTLEMLELTKLEERYPRQLSGGQQQRVALARVLVIQPKIMLFDEPLSNLDAKLRLQMRVEIRNLQKKVGITSIFVTHDQEEALTIADRVVVMHDGGLEQVGTPSEIYDAPRTRFMADFVGISNIFETTVVPGKDLLPLRVRTSRGLEINIGDVGRVSSAETMQVAVRPENMTICPDPEQINDKGNSINGARAVVENALHMGPIIQYNVRFDTGDRAIVHSQYRLTDPTFAEGDDVWVQWPIESCLCLRG
ncbi:MAG: ABC transporter ATP-binding protein [Desulfatiglandales bacterium]